jgi:hypothetical protein
MKAGIILWNDLGLGIMMLYQRKQSDSSSSTASKNS